MWRAPAFRAQSWADPFLGSTHDAERDSRCFSSVLRSPRRRVVTGPRMFPGAKTANRGGIIANQVGEQGIHKGYFLGCFLAGGGRHESCKAYG